MSISQLQNFKDANRLRNVSVFTLENSSGVRVSFTNYGARIVSLLVPDYSGKLDDVVLGFDHIQDYMNAHEPYFGAIVGRCCNRISGATLTLDGQTYSLTKNEFPHHLHGGNHGLHAVIWDVSDQSENQITFQYVSADGEEGYPGNLRITVSYVLTELNEVIIQYKAQTDKKTVINLTNHSYFNLAGAGSGSILNHIITINAHEITEIDENLIPTGVIRPVRDSVFDFNSPKPIGRDMFNMDEQLKFAKGYDHNFVLKNEVSLEPELAAVVYEPKSGRMLEVKTTEPGLQFYTANFLNGLDVGREGIPYQAKTAFCLETQHFPDSPKHDHFPSVLLNPDTEFKSTTSFRFLW